MKLLFVNKEKELLLLKKGFSTEFVYPIKHWTPPVAPSFVRRSTKHKKDENTRIEKKEILKKVRETGWVVLMFIYYIVVFAFLSITVEVGGW